MRKRCGFTIEIRSAVILCKIVLLRQNIFLLRRFNSMLKIKKQISRKGNSYIALFYDNGYEDILLTFDLLKILDIANVTKQQLEQHFLSGNQEYYIKGD